jgi:hypothetical protein
MRSPRRTFAAPFVVTVGLAGCTHIDEAPPRSVPVPRDAAVVVPVPPPEPPPPAPLDLFEEPDPNVTTYTVIRYGTTCTLQYNMYCPPGARCNPPRPRDWKCPAGMTTDRATIRQLRDQNTCTLDAEPTICTDPGTDCPTPPPPRKIPCP